MLTESLYKHQDLRSLRFRFVLGRLRFCFSAFDCTSLLALSPIKFPSSHLLRPPCTEDPIHSGAHGGNKYNSNLISNCTDFHVYNVTSFVPIYHARELHG